MIKTKPETLLVLDSENTIFRKLQKKWYAKSIMKL